ncbi:MAG: hypothetical protein AABX35_01455 [Nanoarchaeota archaeon]
MEVKTIKGIDEGTWMRFKVLAAKKRLTMGKLLHTMVGEYEKKKDEDFWDFILSGERRISDKDADEMEISLKKLRKERGFRDVPNF